MVKKIAYFILTIAITMVISVFATVKYMESHYVDQSNRTYQIFVQAQESGYDGTYMDWLASIAGQDASPIELRVSGEYIQWKYASEDDTSWRDLLSVTSLMGLPGDNGLDGLPGITPHVGDNGNWWIGSEDTGISVGAQGEQGVTPHIGDNGNWWIDLTDTGISATGATGASGLSAYEIFKIYYPEYEGNEDEWLIDLTNGDLAVKTFYTVTFDSSGGTEVASQIVEEGKKAHEPIAPTKANYEFDDWYYGDERWVFVGYIVTDDITLTAQWNEIEAALPKAGTPTISSHTYERHNWEYTLGSTGTQKMLVVPITFSDYPMSEIEKTAMCERIDTAFFGDSEDTAWESVSSYFYKSSYGQLTIEGTVTPVYEAGRTTEEFAAETRTSGPYYTSFDPTWNLVDEVIPWYRNVTGTNLSEYDADADGYIDSLYMIYSNPNANNAEYSANGENVFWAFKFQNYGAFGTSDVNNPVGMMYAWSSIDFSYEGYGPDPIDSHTYIHEVGHILGLNDYYTYDSTGLDYDALGGMDMQDYNILDHNSYSKYYWGWTDPYVFDITSSGASVKLRPFESTGDCILLANSWNGSSFDEYLLLEFYTPTGLNYQDSFNGPYSWRSPGFTIPGIKLLHVDARLANLSLTTGKFVRYTDTLASSNYYTEIAASNTSSRNYNLGINRYFKQVQLIEGSGSNIIMQGYGATNSSLFVEGSSFHPDDFQLFFTNMTTFNNGEPIPFSFTVESITDEYATIDITRIIP